jgi:streptogramin lyase
VSIDSTGKVWVANYFSVASLFANTGTPVFATGITGDNLDNSYGGAVNVNDDAWITNEQSSGSINGGLGTVTVLNAAGASPAAYATGGLDFPISVAFDTSGVAWVVDYGNSHLTLLSSSGTALSGAAGYTTNQFVFPVAVATDSQCNGYIANQSSNTITKVIADGSSFTSYAVGEGPSGLAVDGSNDVWTANYYGNSVGLLSGKGSVLSGTGYTGGGIDHPQGIAVDGAGNVWVANFRGPSLTELAAATASSPGQVLSPSAGWAPESGLLEAFGLAIDASGNVWVTNLGSNTLTEFVGVAAPVKTPLLGPVRVP